MSYPLTVLKQIADGLAKQFGSECEIVIHDLKTEHLENSIVYIVNGHVSARKAGDGPSSAVWDALDLLRKDPNGLKDHLAYLTRTAEGKILKSSTMYIKDETGTLRYLFAINYDITGLLTFDSAIRSITETVSADPGLIPEPIVTNVNDLLDHLIERSVALIGKSPEHMNKEEKIAAIRFLNDSGAFLITKSGDKISQYFGISKFTMYNYMDTKKQ
ncbi:MAG: helix-turn-helix transcriptional regulator [Lachnospiraceae bacterium]|nr:helix-turn-helix transcriptional regulator [Lachnospiraceae bacterium]